MHFPPPLKFYEDGDFCFWHLKDFSVHHEGPTDVWWGEQIDEYYLILAVAFLCPCMFSCSFCIHKARAASLVSRGFLGLTGAGSSHAQPMHILSCSGLAWLCPAPWSQHFRHMLWTWELQRSQSLNIWTRKIPRGSHIHAFSPFWWVAILDSCMNISCLYTCSVIFSRKPLLVFSGWLRGL